MSGAFRVDLGVLASAVERLQRFEQRLHEAADSTDRQVQDLHATWGGAAAQEQREAHARWQQGAREVHEALVALRRAASGAHDNYAAAVRTNSAMWVV